MLEDHGLNDALCDEDEVNHNDIADGQHHGEFGLVDDECCQMDEAEFTWFDETDDECEGDGDEGPAEPPIDSSDVPAARVRVLEAQPEYVRLKDLGLSMRPAGCTLGIHPGAQVWRSSSSTSAHFGRSYGHARTSWQALLRVMELMLDAYIQENSGSHDVKMVKSQLGRIRKFRQQEPSHPD